MQKMPIGFTNFKEGANSVTNCTECSPGFYRVSKSNCLPCKPGFYSDSINSLYCLPCRTGEFSQAQASKCSLCSIGFYNNKETSDSCLPCAPGNFSDSKGMIECKKCIQGYYTPNYGSTRCYECPKGTFNNETGMTKCRKCEMNFYMPNTAAIKCISCPQSLYSQFGFTECIKCEDFNETYSKPIFFVLPTAFDYYQKAKCYSKCPSGYTENIEIHACDPIPAEFPVILVCCITVFSSVAIIFGIIVVIKIIRNKRMRIHAIITRNEIHELKMKVEQWHDSMKQCICRETNFLYEKPVKDARGRTYEESWLNEYKKKHNNYLPDENFVRQEQPFPDFEKINRIQNLKSVGIELQKQMIIAKNQYHE